MITNTQRLLAVTMSLILVVGVSPAFAQVDDAMSGQMTTTPTNNPGIASPQQTSNCALFDLEGTGGNSVPIGVLTSPVTDITFSPNGWYAMNPPWALTNPPSPTTAMVPQFQQGFVTLTMSNPVSTVSFWHDTLNNPISARVFGAGNTLLATIPVPATEFGFFGAGNFQQITHTEVGNVITHIELEGSFNTGRSLYDDFEVCVDSMVGGKSLPIDSTALLIAGASANAVWLMSALVVIGSVAFGALYITSKRN